MFSFVPLKILASYKANEFCYGIQSIPLVGKLIKDSIYTNKIAKAIFTLLSLLNYLMINGLKYFIVYMITWMMADLVQFNSELFSLHLFMMYGIVMSLVNISLFKNDKQQYFATKLIKLNQRSYLISTYFYQVVSNSIFLIYIFTLFCPEQSNLVGLIYSVVVSLSSALFQLKGDKIKIWMILLSISLLFLPYTGFYFTEIHFNYGIVIFSFIAIISLYSLFRVDNFDGEINRVEEKDLNTLKKQLAKSSISDKAIKGSKKEGVAYLNELFVQRHHSSFIDKYRVIWGGLIVAMIAGLIINTMKPELLFWIEKSFVREPFALVVVFYFVIDCDPILNLYFNNCDVSLLHYRFYRTPKVVTTLFIERLKTILYYTLITFTIYSTVMSILYTVNATETNTMDYIAFFCNNFLIGIFFISYSLILYYLLQPFTENSKVKRPSYTFFRVLLFIIASYVKEIEIWSIKAMYILFPTVGVFVIVMVALTYLVADQTFRIRK